MVRFRGRKLYVVPKGGVMRLHMRLIFCIGLLWLASSCAVNVVHIAFDVEISGTDAEGRAWRAAPEDIKSIPRGTPESPRYPAIQFEHKNFRWTIGAGVSAIGGLIQTRKSGQEVCFRFDEARLRSNMHEEEIPLRVVEALYFLPSGHVVRIANYKGRTTPTPVPPICFSDRPQNFHFAPDLSALFPSGRMFNIDWPKDDAKRLQGGMGNWVGFRVPIESDGRREVLDIRLIATDKKVVTKYQTF